VWRHDEVIHHEGPSVTMAQPKMAKGGIYRRGTEYAEIFYFKFSPPRPPLLRGELSEPFSISV